MDVAGINKVLMTINLADMLTIMISAIIGGLVGFYFHGYKNKLEYQHKVYDKVVQCVIEMHTCIIEYLRLLKLVLIDHEDSDEKQLDEARYKCMTKSFELVGFLPNKYFEQVAAVLSLSRKFTSADGLSDDEMKTTMFDYFQTTRNVLGMETLGENLKKWF